jgi:hypothetical protein
MAWAVLRLRLKTSAWASWQPHWPTCHATICAFSRGDSIGFDSIRGFAIFSYFCLLYQKLK